MARTIASVSMPLILRVRVRAVPPRRAGIWRDALQPRIASRAVYLNNAVGVGSIVKAHGKIQTHEAAHHSALQARFAAGLVRDA